MIDQVQNELDRCWPRSHLAVLHVLRVTHCCRLVKARCLRTGTVKNLMFFVRNPQFEHILELRSSYVPHANYLKRCLREELEAVFRRSVDLLRYYRNNPSCLSIVKNHGLLAYTFNGLGPSLLEEDRNWSWEEKIARFLGVIDFFSKLQKQGVYVKHINLKSLHLGKNDAVVFGDFIFLYDSVKRIGKDLFLPSEWPDHPLKDRLVNPSRHDIQDVYATVLTLKEWITKDQESVGKSSPDRFAALEDLFADYLEPVRLPDYEEGLGSFAELGRKLQKLLPPVDLTVPASRITSDEAKAPIKITPARRASRRFFKIPWANVAAMILVAFMATMTAKMVRDLIPDIVEKPRESRTHSIRSPAFWSGRRLNGTWKFANKPAVPCKLIIGEVHHTRDHLTMQFRLDSPAFSSEETGAVFPRNHSIRLGKYGLGMFGVRDGRLFMEQKGQTKNNWLFKEQ